MPVHLVDSPVDDVFPDEVVSSSPTDAPSPYPTGDRLERLASEFDAHDLVSRPLGEDEGPRSNPIPPDTNNPPVSTTSILRVPLSYAPNAAVPLLKLNAGAAPKQQALSLVLDTLSPTTTLFLKETNVCDSSEQKDHSSWGNADDCFSLRESTTAAVCGSSADCEPGDGSTIECAPYGNTEQAISGTKFSQVYTMPLEGGLWLQEGVEGAEDLELVVADSSEEDLGLDLNEKGGMAVGRRLVGRGCRRELRFQRLDKELKNAVRDPRTTGRLWRGL